MNEEESRALFFYALLYPAFFSLQFIEKLNKNSRNRNKLLLGKNYLKIKY